MFNVTIIRLRDLIKYLLTLIVIIIIIYMGKRYFFNETKTNLNNINLGDKITNNINKSILYSINLEMPEIEIIAQAGSKKEEKLVDENTEDADKEFMSKIFTSMIDLELGVINVEGQEKEQETEQIGKEEEKPKEEKPEEQSNSTSEENLVLASTNVKTEVVTENPIKEAYTDKCNGVKIKNETNFNLTDDITNINNLKIDSSNVIIFHTHTCESYTSSEKYSYTPTGNYRTTDLSYSVARVGDELTKYLSNYGFNTTHDKTYHDYPSYSGSYTRSLSTVSNILKDTKSDIIIDLHRDAIGSYSSYAPTVKIGDDYCAQIMFVIGTNGGGLYHPNWQSNLQFAIKLQKVANELYPGLFKPIILRNSRYNQHLGKAANIIEVGSTGNTLEQCLNSMKYLSEVMNTALK